MNGTSRLNRNSGDGHDPEGLDPGLLQLFDAASQQTPLDAPDHFIAATLLQMKHEARTRLTGRYAAIVMIMTLGALLAPFVAEITLYAMSWMTDHLVATGMTLLSPLGCVCAALLAWRTARRT